MSLLWGRGLADDGPAVVAEHQHRESLDRLPIGRVHTRIVEPPPVGECLEHPVVLVAQRAVDDLPAVLAVKVREVLDRPR